MAEASNNLFRSKKHQTCGFADILSAAARRRSQSAPTRSVPDWKPIAPKSAYSMAKHHPLARAASHPRVYQTPLPLVAFTRLGTTT